MTIARMDSKTLLYSLDQSRREFFLHIPDALLDVRSDVIQMLQTRYKCNEVGLPQAYFEYACPPAVEGMESILHRFVYQSFSYQISNPPDLDDYDQLRQMFYKDVTKFAESEGVDTSGMLVWRLPEKIALHENLCSHCGGHFTMRGRIAFVPAGIAQNCKIYKPED